MTIRSTAPFSLALAFCAAAVLTLAGDSAADDPTAEPDPVKNYFWVDTATVVDVAPDEGRLRVMSGGVGTTYAVDEGSLIRKGGETIPLARLEPGDRVAISAHEGLRVEDPPVADMVQIVAVDPETGEPRTRASRAVEGEGPEKAEAGGETEEAAGGTE